MFRMKFDVQAVSANSDCGLFCLTGSAERLDYLCSIFQKYLYLRFQIDY